MVFNFKKPSHAGLPMLYQDLVELSVEQHLGWGLCPSSKLECARHANAIPLGVNEFFLAGQHFPVVFGPVGSGGGPVAVTGLVEGSNLFVDSQGQWRKGAYLPGYLRRYPFWVQFGNDMARASVWFDPNGGSVVPLVEQENALPFFDFRGQVSKTLKEIVEFARLCAAEEVATGLFMQALEAENLLKEQQVKIKLTHDNDYLLSGFRCIDTDAFRQLSDALLADWSRKGWIGIITIHLFSIQHNWLHLLDIYQYKNNMKMDF